jgi:hypothetical protein
MGWWRTTNHDPLDLSQTIARPNKAMLRTPSTLSRCVFQMLQQALAQLIAVVGPINRRLEKCIA